jgi:hypothetical protein
VGIRWFADVKTEWRDNYLETKSISQVYEAAGFELHPNPENVNMQERPIGSSNGS